MSGTPIADDPYNLAALFNMLRGYMTIGKDKFTAFPSDYDQFRYIFVDENNNKMKNQKLFGERIVGLVSYYNGIYDDSTDLFPAVREHIVECKMSAHQLSGYNEVRKKEIRNEKNSKQQQGNMKKSSFKKPSALSLIHI